LSNKIKTVEASYTQAVQHDISHLNINYDDIQNHWCKYGTLVIEMKDGTRHEIDNGNYLDVDFKWPEELRFYNKDDEDITGEEDE
tara:strand:- start:2149 stop:2403 length:255 start_codon:yes stop_codon:yes gene_type:complete